MTCAVVACGGDDGAASGDDGGGDDGGGDDGGGDTDSGVDGPGGSGAYELTVSGTRNGAPFVLSRPCFTRLEDDNAKLEAYDSAQGFGFQVRWETTAMAAMTYPNGGFDPEVIVAYKYIVGDSDTNLGTKQGTVTFDVIGQAVGGEVAGHFDGVILDNVDLQLSASGTFRCLLN